MRSERGTSAGFTLLEALIAFALLALVLAAAIPALGGAAARQANRVQSLLATEFAVSVAEQYRATFPLMPTSGTDPSGWHWHIDESRVAPDGPTALDSAMMLIALNLTVWHTDRPEDRASLQTIVARQAMKGRNTQAGVTLLETMIGLALMALMALMLSGVLGNGIRVLGRSGALGGDLEQALARRDLRLWLENALGQGPPDEARAVFAGTPDGFSALALPPEGLFWPGVATQITVTGTTDLTATGLAATAENGSGAPLTLSARLASPGQRLTVQYWGRRTAQAGPAWYSDWPAAAPPPLLVRIEFAGPGRALPPLVIRLAKSAHYSEMSLSSLVPPALPSRP